MEKTGMIGSLSQDSGLASKQITKIENIIMWRKIINKVFLYSGMGVAVFWTRVGSKSRVTEKRHDKKE